MTIPEQNRREAFEAVGPENPNWRTRILACLEIFGPLSAFDVAEKTGKAVYVVRPRLTELFKAGAIKPIGKKIAPTGKRETIWETIE